MLPISLIWFKKILVFKCLVIFVKLKKILII